MSEQLKIQGVIEEKKVTASPHGSKRQWVRTALKVNGQTMACFESLDFYEGDNVIVYYTNDGKYNTITSVEYANEAHQVALSPGVSSPNKDKLIVRQSCLKAAIDLYGIITAPMQASKEIMALAEEFEKWVWRE